MNTRAIALTCALSAAACAGSETRPAQDPAWTNSNTTTTAATTPPTTARSPSTSASTDYASPNPVAPVGAMSSTSTTSAPQPMPMPYTSTPAATPTPATSPVVANNPGVANHTNNADNTKINDRDRHDALTPMAQGNSGAEIKITATIRKGMMSDKTLSFAAKNVKVITVGTKVTLRGPVKSEQERATVEALARQTAGVTEVDNQLEVKN